jgi:hypothetical protein
MDDSSGSKKAHKPLLEHVFWPIVSAIAGGTVAVIVKHLWEKRLGPSQGVPHPLLADTLDARLLASSLALLPTNKTVLSPPGPAIDAVLGGRSKSKKDIWRYWSSADGGPSGVVASYLIGKAGWPLDMVNRARDDAWAPGSGFEPGKDVEKAKDGAKKRGWLVTPVFSNHGESPSMAGADSLVDALDLGFAIGEVFELEPGDYFAVANGQGVENVGVIVEVAHGKKSNNVITVEGCLTDGGLPCARWRRRVFRDDGSFSQEVGSQRLLWVIRPT